MPAPPYSAGTSTPIRPFSPSTFMLASGNSPVWSWCSALGAMRSAAMRRATSWIINCSSVNWKSTAVLGGVRSRPHILADRGPAPCPGLGVQPGLEGFGRHGLAVQMALRDIAAARAQRAGDRLVLDPLAHHRQAEAMGQVDDHARQFR